MRNRQAPHIDFTALKGAIGSNNKLLPSNIDMALERRGNFLFGEWKRPGELISEGQKILLKALAKAPNTYVLIIEGDTDNEMTVENFYYVDGNVQKKLGHGLEELKEVLNSWYEYADKK